ncbi:MAG: hypothetical protein JW860_12330, partial [Sedimentisphaerales bacterium]|nr:hypothetical protein [Sedimentisphaerales bacterium]
NASQDLQNVCKSAIHAFNSLKWSSQLDMTIPGDIPFLNTAHEFNIFIEVIHSQDINNEECDIKKLDNLINKLKMVIDESSKQEERIRAAEYLQKFFDAFGDYSYYSTREIIQESRMNPWI